MMQQLTDLPGSIISVVLKRFSNKVNTLGLAKLTILTVDDCTIMRESYSKVSAWLHSQGVGLNRNLPSPEDVKGEIDVLDKWFEDLTGRQAAIKMC